MMPPADEQPQQEVSMTQEEGAKEFGRRLRRLVEWPVREKRVTVPHTPVCRTRPCSCGRWSSRRAARRPDRRSCSALRT